MTGAAGPAVTAVAPAKINLCLGVGPRRSDGFHPLATVYQAISLYDEVRVTGAVEGAGPDSVTVVGRGVDVAAVPTDHTNLAVRAARLLSRSAGRAAGRAAGLGDAVDIHITKQIPVSGGLAGGSADAAAVLVACVELWGLETSMPELLVLAAELGSDVPFALLGGTAAGSGRGELVTPVRTHGSTWWVVLPATDGLSTPAVYARFDELTDGRRAQPQIPSDLLTALEGGDLPALGSALTNDLQAASFALRPELAGPIADGLAAGALGALVTGSGPTTVHLAESREHAARVRLALEASGHVGAVVAEGPVPGARVVGVSP